MASKPANDANGLRGKGPRDAAHETPVVSFAVQVFPEHAAVAATEMEIFDVTTAFAAVTQLVRLSPTST